MTPDIPPQAITAVYDGPGGRLDLSREDITDILEAAAPHLAAAEREACARLAEAEVIKLNALHENWADVSAGALEDFADLLRKDHP